eukprot:NODE_1470_length_1406_cov_7.147384_g1221_i0.p2 GENE.NODE_1470_length_1406_cov_7.147384_g1221_i0~~NODE_1470_length_1406_cov_7.147384_g1221_i0.p2  ORF type:complete len:303 (+),score=109.63 NODE_1470_length_1406_cov_7.147384_g1221_i0:424-1332(+)
MQTCMEEKVNPNATMDGVTALMAAAANNQLEAVQLLCKVGPSFGLLVDTRDPAGQTALAYAKHRNNQKIVQCLLEVGATPLSGPLEAPKLIERVGAGTPQDPNRNPDDLSPLPPPAPPTFSVALLGADSFEKIRQYIEAKPTDSYVPSNVSFSAKLAEKLGKAAMDGDEEVIRQMIDAKEAHLHSRHRAMTPLMHAAERGHLEICKLLMDTGASLAPVDCYGLQALHWACKTGKLEVVELFLTHGANPMRPSRLGDRPFDLAKGNQHRDITSLMIQLAHQKKLAFKTAEDRALFESMYLSNF